MFNPEMPRAAQRAEEPDARQSKSVETAAAAEALEKEASVSQRQNPETMSSDVLTRDTTEAEAGRIAEQLVAKRMAERDAEAEKQFREQVAQQYKMIDQELLRYEQSATGHASLQGEKRVFSQDKMDGSGGISERILAKLEHIPGGKKIFGALTLVAALSSLPEGAEARDRGRSFGERVGYNAQRSVEREASSILNEIIRIPGRAVREEIRRSEQEKREQEQRIRRDRAETLREQATQERAFEQYVSNVAQAITDFKGAFDRVILAQLPTSRERDTALLQEVSNTLNTLEKHDNAYLARGGTVFELSTLAKERLQTFREEIQAGTYADLPWVDNPLQEVSLANFRK